jgi:hypothetical protein
MADKLLPAVGEEVSATGVARHYHKLLGAYVIDRVDAAARPEIEGLLDGGTVAVVDTLMVDDEAATSLAAAALACVGAGA